MPDCRGVQNDFLVLGAFPPFLNGKPDGQDFAWGRRCLQWAVFFGEDFAGEYGVGLFEFFRHATRGKASGGGRRGDASRNHCGSERKRLPYSHQKYLRSCRASPQRRAQPGCVRDATIVNTRCGSFNKSPGNDPPSNWASSASKASTSAGARLPATPALARIRPRQPSAVYGTSRSYEKVSTLEKPAACK